MDSEKGPLHFAIPLENKEKMGVRLAFLCREKAAR